MGIHLNSDGGLTESQSVQAKALGMSHEEFKRQLLERLYEMRGGLPKTERTDKMKRTSITANNPVLVLGAGPSSLKHINDIKKFTGIIMAVDLIFNELVENGIIPDYIVTLESQKQVVNENLFTPENIVKAKHKTKMICSSITRNVIEDWFKSHGGKVERFIIQEEPRCSNVGLLSINYAYERLKADKIVLLGFEHVGQKYPPHIYEIWQTDFWYFIRKWPKELIVNCTDGGALYYEDYILDAQLGEIVWNKS